MQVQQCDTSTLINHLRVYPVNGWVHWEIPLHKQFFSLFAHTKNRTYIVLHVKQTCQPLHYEYELSIQVQFLFKFGNINTSFWISQIFEKSIPRNWREKNKYTYEGKSLNSENMVI